MRHAALTCVVLQESFQRFCAACSRRVVSAFLQVEATFREWMLTQDTDAMPRSRITLDEFHALVPGVGRAWQRRASSGIRSANSPGAEGSPPGGDGHGCFDLFLATAARPIGPIRPSFSFAHFHSLQISRSLCRFYTWSCLACSLLCSGLTS